MALMGLVQLYCPVCGIHFWYGASPVVTYHHREFGVVCGVSCLRRAQLKYARMLLGKADDDDNEKEVPSALGPGQQ